MKIPEDGSLHACWGSSGSEMFFVGEQGTMIHFDGSKWKKFPKVTTKDLGSVWGSSRTNVWACGWNQTTAESVLLHFDGTSWSDVDPKLLGDIGPGRHGLIGVWSVDSAGQSFNYGNGSFVHHQRPGGTWLADTLGNKLGTEAYAGLNFIRGNGPNDLFVSGSGGFTAHWNGNSWRDYPEFFNFGGSSDIWALSVKQNTVAMAGYKNGQGFVRIGRRR